METLQLVFRYSDGKGRRTITLPAPVADIDDQLDDLEQDMQAFFEPILVDPATFDEAHHIERTSTELINLIN
jgi:hypothetical protein